MRGSGYAIGEILVFLAIASIIGFLVGWLVFYRRPGKGGAELSSANPNHVRHLETRAKAVDSKVTRMERQASALLKSLEKLPTTAAAAATQKAADTKPAKPPEIEKVSTPVDKPEVAKVVTPEPGKAKEAAAKGKETADAQADKAKAAAAKGKETADAQADKAKAAAAKAKETVSAPGGEGVDSYLSEADERISKLEDTLDKLSEKLAEFDEE